VNGAAKRRAVKARMEELDAGALLFEETEYDDAILGLVTVGHGEPIVVYDPERVLDAIARNILHDDPTLTEEELADEAMSHMDFNVLGSTPEGAPGMFEAIQPWWDPEYEPADTDD